MQFRKTSLEVDWRQGNQELVAVMKVRKKCLNQDNGPADGVGRGPYLRDIKGVQPIEMELGRRFVESSV